MPAVKSTSEGAKVDNGRASDQARLQARDTVRCFDCRRKSPEDLRLETIDLIGVSPALAHHYLKSGWLYRLGSGILAVSLGRDRQGGRRPAHDR